MKLSEIVHEYNEDTQAIRDFCEELYTKQFSKYFEQVHELYGRLQSESRPISDSELEYILVMFPLDLIAVGEQLNKLRLDYEVVRLKNKDKLEDLRDKWKFNTIESMMSKTEKQEYISHKVAQDMVEYEILLSAYSSIVSRVESEMSFSRELIMGAKKVWDSRRSAESVSDASQLPEYSRDTAKTGTYIK